MKAENIDDRPEWTECDQVRSDTTDTIYTIYRHKHTLDLYMCDCLGFRANRPCKHVKKYVFNDRLKTMFLNFEANGFLAFQSEGAEDAIVKRIETIRKEIFDAK